MVFAFFRRGRKNEREREVPRGRLPRVSGRIHRDAYIDARARERFKLLAIFCCSPGERER